MADYFKVTTTKKEYEASRIAADMRFSFTVEPNKNLPLLKAYKNLILASNNRLLKFYYLHYFEAFNELVDVNTRYGMVQPDEEVLVDEFKERIKDFVLPTAVRERMLGIPQDKTSGIINEIDLSHYNEIQ